jgi:hypothetical protein
MRRSGARDERAGVRVAGASHVLAQPAATSRCRAGARAAVWTRAAGALAITEIRVE